MKPWLYVLIAIIGFGALALTITSVVSTIEPDIIVDNNAIMYGLDRQLQQVDDKPGERPSFFIYEVWCNCMYIDERTTTTPGMPNVEYEDKYFRFRISNFATDRPPGQVTVSVLNDAGFCPGGGLVFDILRKRQVRYISHPDR